MKRYMKHGVCLCKIEEQTLNIIDSKYYMKHGVCLYKIEEQTLNILTTLPVLKTFLIQKVCTSAFVNNLKYL